MVTATSSLLSDDHERVAHRLFRLAVGLFFIGGFLTSSVSLLVPQLKLLLNLDYKGALLVQLAFHSSYMLFALPITAAIIRAGYMRAIVAGLTVMTIGCLTLTMAQTTLSFAMVLGALLLISAGQTYLQIASNTMVAVIGPLRGAAGRLTLLQGFNSLGTVLGPLVSAPLLLRDLGATAARPFAATLPFMGTAAVTGALSFAYFRHRDLLKGQSNDQFAATREIFRVMRSRRLLWGTSAIFLYVGAEVTIGALLPTVLMRSDRLAAPPVLAGQLVSLYWGGAMIGRFVGAWAMRRVSEARLLLAVAIAAAGLTMAAILLPGPAGAGSLIAVGLCNAIMYPTIYTLALPTDEREAPVASMWLCMAVVGGAIVPVLTGAIADAATLLASLALPALCYLFIAWFASICTQPQEIPA
jgi:FHS family L-fucose permease-like MFS transporter